MQNDKSRNSVEQWLDTIPEPSDLQDSLDDTSPTPRPLWVRKDQMKSVVLHGNQLFFKGKEAKPVKTRNADEIIPKRVTFKTSEDPDQTAASEDETGCSDRQSDVRYRLMRRKPDEDRLELARHMNRHLLGVYQRKMTERTTPHFVYETHAGKSPRNQVSDSAKVVKETLQLDYSEDTGCLQPNRVCKSSPASPVGDKQRQSPKPSRGGRRPSSCRLADGIKKPIIQGLVVDSASNQKPSIVRASKNANIREEFALQQKIAGYKKSCSQNINTIKIAQRRLSSSWLKLRNKMAQNKMDEKQMEEFKNTSDQLFLRNKGYMPTRKESLNHFWFPPLPKRRVMTVH